MLIGVSYNFFNGEEHLIASIKSIRRAVSHVQVVFQQTSNTGEAASIAAVNTLQQAVQAGLVDSVIDYVPNLRKAKRHNELTKRRKGMRALKALGCSHYLGMDADEFYRHDELEWAKEHILKHGYTITTAPSFMHVISPKYRALDTTNVAFISKLDFFTQVGFPYYPEKNVDSTRKIFNFPIKHKKFQPNELAMYHMNLVREDFSSKLKNTSTTDKSFLSKLEAELAEYKLGATFDFGKKGKFQPELVENEFFTFDPTDA